MKNMDSDKIIGPYKEMIGKTFGRLKVVKRLHRPKGKDYIWECICICGKTKQTYGSLLRKGNTKSCGCLRYEQISKLGKLTKTHGMNKTKAYNSWQNLVQRTTNPNHRDYHHYGGRGINLDPKWLKFENFYEDLGAPPSPKHSIDRIDVNGNYEPGNCRWATHKEQNNNKRNTVFIEFNGQTKTLNEWGFILDMKPNMIYTRLFRYNWSIEKTLTIPSQKRKYGK